MVLCLRIKLGIWNRYFSLHAERPPLVICVYIRCVGLELNYFLDKNAVKDNLVTDGIYVWKPAIWEQ